MISYDEINEATAELQRRASAYGQTSNDTKRAAEDMGFDSDALVDAGITATMIGCNAPSAYVLGAMVGFILGVKDARKMIDDTMGDLDAN